MNVALRTPRMSLDEFLAWESQQEERWEFDGFGPVAMVGGTLRHNEIVGNLDFALRPRLTRPCRAYRETVRVRTGRGTIRYPDLLIVCSRIATEATEIADPEIVFEVLSKSTSRKDRIEKAVEYLATVSIQRYVLLEQDAVATTSMRRSGGAWEAVVLTGSAVLDLPEVGVQIPLPEIYTGIELEDDQPTPPA